MTGETKTYTEQELIQFGLYLLSAEREEFIKSVTVGNHKTKVKALRSVYEQDLKNFNYLMEKNKQQQTV